MNLFFKPKKLILHDILLKNKVFSNIKNDFSSLLESNIQDVLQFDNSGGLLLIINKVNDLENDEAFKITSSEDTVNIYAKTEAGAYYACCLLEEILPQTNKTFEIEDSPDLKIRGVMIDISRSKVPNLATLKEMINMLAKLRYNHVELYVEGFSFEYKSFPHVLGDKNYITLEDYLEIEKYAIEHYIDFVPNQNGFGHMADWLEREEYKHLADSPDGFFIWGCDRKPTTLNPGDNESIELVKKMYSDMLPYVKSKYFNMNFDEPYELGQGKSKELTDKSSIEDVYIDYFLKLVEEVRLYNKTPMLWGDVIIKTPDKLHRLPSDAIFIDWGYDKKYPFEKHAKLLEENNVKYMLAPGTVTWSSIGGRILDMEQTILKSAQNAKKHNGLGVLITDWGDMGHLQYLPVSYLGFILGGLSSWTNAILDDAITYLKAMLKDDALCEAIIELGKYHLLEGPYQGYGSRLFSSILWAEHSKRQKDPIDFYLSKMFLNVLPKQNIELLKISFEKVEKLLSIANEGIVTDEMKNSVKLLKTLVSINESLAKLKEGSLVDFDEIINELKQYLIEHERLWLMRNIKYGFEFSASRIKWLIEILTKIARKGNLC